MVIDTQLVDGWLEIDVTDAGPGMDGHPMTQLFAPPDDHRRTGATAAAGLGLYVVALLAQANEGSVDIRRPSQTAHASLRLPPA